MDSAYLPYIVTEAFCIIYAAVMLSRLQSEVGEGRELMSLKKMIAAYMVMLATDIACIIPEFIIPSGPHIITAVFSGISVSAVAFGCYRWYQFVEIRINPAAGQNRKTERLIRIPLFAVCALDLISSFTGWVFYIDDGGRYSLGELFWIQGVVTFAYLLVPTVQAAYAAVRTREAKKRREYATYVVYICICSAVVAVEDFIPTVPVFALGVFAAIQILFLTLYLDKEYALAKQERELTEAQVGVVLSQLQPHFLFNALMAIQDLCHGRAPEAEQTVVEFAEYLRGNIDSLRCRGTIPFSRELKHTKNYLSLENRRFAGKIRVEYDIRAENFGVPALTLQPIVEHAVRYGVTQRVEGGSIRICSEETDDAYRVRVEDDGVGFDPENAKPEESGNSGIGNVRARLREMCGGSLRVASKPGEGTAVEIAIPKDRRAAT